MTKLMTKKVVLAHLSQADESLKAANCLFEQRLYASSCNRSWFAIMQSLTAAASAVFQPSTKDEPYKIRHCDAAGVYCKLLAGLRSSTNKMPKGFDIEHCLVMRTSADYLTGEITIADASTALAVAGRVRRVVDKLLRSRD